MEKKRFPFDVVDGGKRDSLSAVERKRQIAADRKRQDDLTPQERLDLAKRKQEEGIQDIRASIARFNGTVLSDQEARILHHKMPAFVLGDTQVEKELREQFPQLHEWFDQRKI